MGLAMELKAYREHPREQARIASLIGMVPSGVRRVLDVGSRDGYIAIQLADLGVAVTALDLELPRIYDSRIECVQGNAVHLPFPDRSFDLVLCAEVLEHLPEPMLGQACAELSRVSSSHVLLGVPFRQDLRVGRLTCRACGGISPPWGHVNSFDEAELIRRFPGWRSARSEFVGVGGARTNELSMRLMDWAGNPWGSYDQDEPCIHCGRRFTPPPPRTVRQRVLTRVAALINAAQRPFQKAQGNWLHLLLESPSENHHVR